jgi:hypothetical protein
MGRQQRGRVHGLFSENITPFEPKTSMRWSSSNRWREVSITPARRSQAAHHNAVFYVAARTVARVDQARARRWTPPKPGCPTGVHLVEIVDHYVREMPPEVFS